MKVAELLAKVYPHCNHFRYSCHNGVDRDSWEFSWAQIKTLSIWAAVYPESEIDLGDYSLETPEGRLRLAADGSFVRSRTITERFSLEELVPV